MKFPRIMVLAATLSLLAAACSGSGDTAATTTTITTLPPVTTTTAAPTTTSSTTTTSTTTTTTTLGPQHPSPLNGMEVEDPQLLERRAIAVKIDNHWNARPQSGIQEADLVFELLVEGGLTRFIAVFHHSDSDYLGPIRSLRPTDSTLLFLDAPLQISGGQDWVSRLASGRGQKLIGDDRISTFRISSRRGPHNLYGTTLKMRETADRRGWPDEPPKPIFTFGHPISAVARAETITFDWSARPEVIWSYDRISKSYLRFNKANEHNWLSVDGDGDQVTTDTLLVLTARRYTASPSGKGTPVPALDTVGTGEALLFYNGLLSKGTWERDEYDEPFRLALPSGDEMIIPGGRLWISIFPTSGSVDWE